MRQDDPGLRRQIVEWIRRCQGGGVGEGTLLLLIVVLQCFGVELRVQQQFKQTKHGIFDIVRRVRERLLTFKILDLNYK